jgi:hypothetical protein
LLESVPPQFRPRHRDVGAVARGSARSMAHPADAAAKATTAADLRGPRAAAPNEVTAFPRPVVAEAHT